MSYEEKYKEALEKAKSKIKNDKGHVLYEDDIVEIFPELAESEDEKIRKWIRKELESKYVVDNIVNNKTADKAFAWLEKQGESKESPTKIQVWDYCSKISREWWQIAMNRWNTLTDEDKNKYNQFIGFNDFSDTLMNITAGALFQLIDTGKLEYEEGSLLLEKPDDTPKSLEVINTINEKSIEEYDVPDTPIKDSEEVTSRMKYIDENLKPIAEFVISYSNWDLRKDEWNHPVPTVPLFRVLDALIQKGKPYSDGCSCLENQGKKDSQVIFPTFTFDDILVLQCCLQAMSKNDELYKQLQSLHDRVHEVYGLENHCEQKSNNNTEPKFKVGYWIYHKISKNTIHINKIENGLYISDEGATISLDRQDDWRLWTINDAKDGDVLFTTCNNTNEMIFIYHGIEFDVSNCYFLYSNTKNEYKTFNAVCSVKADITPATKEQRNFLFQKMKEAGYIWDAEKKELKKIKQRSTDNVEPKFKVGY